MNLVELIEMIKTGYVAGKSALQSDEDRAAEFDKLMESTVSGVREDAYQAFRVMMDSELEEAVRHVREMTWNECCEASKGIGAPISPENPYTREAIARQQAAQEGESL